MSPVVRELARMVAWPTVSNRPLTELAAHLAARHADQGCRVERFDADEPGKCTVVASLGPEGTGGLTLTGHMDVVPAEEAGWTTDPFRLTERGTRLLGRGTSDMKGFLAATLQALDRLEPGALRRELVLVWTHDEEVGCLGSARLVDALTASGRTLPRPCLVGEPTGFRILRMHPGHVALTIEVTGRSAHSGRPDLGVNAIEVAADVVAAVRRLAGDLAAEPADLPELARPTVAVNVARIHGGSALNVVPDRCLVQVGYRPLPGMRAGDVAERLQERLAELPLPDGATVALHVDRASPSLLTPAGTELERCLAPHASAEGTGAATFATDGGNLALLGTEPLVFGPGSIDVAHRPDEWIDRGELERAVDVVEAVIRARCCG